jgi:KDO2-lipid IV(A) lauroyltransferase
MLWKGLHATVYLITWISSRLAALLPRWFCYAVAVRFSGLCFYLLHAKRSALEANLAQAMPGVDAQVRHRTARAVFANFAKYLVDFVLLPRMSCQETIDCVDFEHIDDIRRLAQEGKGIIFVTAHLGNWDIGAAALTAFGFSVNAVVDGFPNLRMERFVRATREHLRIRSITNGRVGPSIIRALKRGEMLALVIDRPEGNRGIAARFFGGNVRAPSGPARLALRSGARIMPGVVVRRTDADDRFEAIVDTKFSFAATGDDDRDIAGLTQALLTSIEGLIARYPEQWYMFRPMWKVPKGETWPVRAIAREA